MSALIDNKAMLYFSAYHIDIGLKILLHEKDIGTHHLTPKLVVCEIPCK